MLLHALRFKKTTLLDPENNTENKTYRTQDLKFSRETYATTNIRLWRSRTTSEPIIPPTLTTFPPFP